VGQLNALQQTVGNLQASNNTLTTRIATLEAENTTLTAANMTLMAQVQNLLKGTAAGSTAGGGAGAAPLVTFVATPAMVNHQDLINYSTKVGTTIHNEGCKKLTTEFDMKSSGTVIYTTELQAKCVKMGWHMGTQQIINFTNAAGSTINIVHQYEQINTATLQAQCKVFCKSTGALLQARARQNNTMMSKCIMKTLTPAARVRLLPFQGDYKVDNVIYAPLLHKKIMALATINSVATTKTLHSNTYLLLHHQGRHKAAPLLLRLQLHPDYCPWCNGQQSHQHPLLRVHGHPMQQFQKLHQAQARCLH
jgi:hypothetical protein